jgi:SAM-dependent methyltransferase
VAEAVDYFSNHSLKLRFPWSLYHAPIVRELSRAVERSPGPEVLNIGSGPFLERESLSRGAARRFTVCDIDPRAIELARQIHGPALAGADVIEAGRPLPYPASRFDLVVAMDVVEHIIDPLPWVLDAVRVLRPGGTLFLTTPNYASRSLTIIEKTALELIARIQGFSRRHLHPTKFDAPRLRALLAQAGLGEPTIREISLGWVLAAHATKRPT